MAILQMTPEQLATLAPEPRRVSRVTTETITDTDATTGEILRSHTAQQTIGVGGSEPPYIKMYYKTMMAMWQIDDVPVDMLLAISSHITWSNDGEPMIFCNNRMVRESICQHIGIKSSMYTKYIRRCVDGGLLIPKPDYRGVYEVNPFFVARGKWDSIRSLRTRYSYIDGKWSVYVEDTIDDGDGQTYTTTQVVEGVGRKVTKPKGIPGQMAMAADGTLFEEVPHE